MEFVIYQNGEPFGTACVEEKGARLHFYAKCPFIPGIYRLYVWKTDGKALPLGVLLPENGMLTLDRTLSRPRQLSPGLACFQYGVLCAGDTPPEPLADETAPQTEAEPPAEEDREPPRARLDRWLETVRPESFTEDEVLRKTLAGAEGILYRYRAGCVELAVPEAAHAHIAPALLFTRAEKLRGGNYFVLKLSAQGLPCRADEPSTY